MAQVTIQEERSVLEMLVDGELFALYNFDPNAQAIYKPFFHPIIGPSGLSITQNGEYSGTLRGHYWHRGLMIAHQRVNGVSFWEERQDCGRIIHQSFEEINSGSDKGDFTELLAFSSARSLWGTDAEIDGRAIALTAGARDVSLIALTSS